MHQTREDYRTFHRRRHATLMRLLANHVPVKVERCLDIGGGGDIADAVAVIRERYAGEVYAVDLEGDVERGRAKGVLSTRCNVDLEPLPFEDRFFDLALFASVIEHLYNPYHVLKELARVLKPGAVLIVEAPNAVSLGRRLDALVGKNPFRFFHRFNAFQDKSVMVDCSVFYTLEEVEALLKRDFDLRDRGYGQHSPKMNPIKALARETAYRIHPRLADFFYVVAACRGPRPAGLGSKETE